MAAAAPARSPERIAVEDAAVVRGAALAAVVALVERGHQRQARQHVSQHLLHHGVAGGAGEFDVEVAGQALLRAVVRAGVDRLLVEGQLFQPVQFRRGRRGHHRGDGGHLENPPGFEQLLGLGAVRRGDEGATVAAKLDQMRALENGDRAADRGAADPEVTRDHVFHELGPRAQGALGHRLHQRGADPLGCILGGLFEAVAGTRPRYSPFRWRRSRMPIAIRRDRPEKGSHDAQDLARAGYGMSGWRGYCR